MFKRLGLPVTWTNQEYAALVSIGGGKERLAHYFDRARAERLGLPVDDDERAALTRRWHLIKTELYTEIVGSGALPPRPGIRRLIGAALDGSWRVGVASTSTNASVHAVLAAAVGPKVAERVPVFAGDVVARKKPAPDIYLHALAEMGAARGDSVVVEDSAVGLAAARAAGLATLVTTSAYTAQDDFTGAAAVLSDLGEPERPARVVRDDWGVRPVGFVGLADLVRTLEVARRRPDWRP